MIRMPFVRLREGLALKVKQIQAIKDADLRCLPVGQQLLAPCLSAAAAALTAKESIRQFLYRAGVFRQHSLPAPVISVGNLTPASGKTPIVMHIARHLFQFHGITSLIVQTGGGTVDETVMMENEFRWVLTSTLRPDERYSLATLTRTHSHSLVPSFASDTPIKVVGDTNSPSELKELLTNSPGLRLVLLDNGLQHLPLLRDLDIVTINSRSPFGNGHLRPRGSLREPAAPALRRADAVVVHHVDIAGDERVSNTLSIIETLIPRHTLRIQTAMSPTALRFLLVRLISTVVRSPRLAHSSTHSRHALRSFASLRWRLARSTCRAWISARNISATTRVSACSRTVGIDLDRRALVRPDSLTRATLVQQPRCSC